MPRYLAALTAALAVLGLPAVATAADSYVDDDGSPGAACTQANPCPTIAAGIAAAGAADTVHVANGNYQETVTLDGGKSLVGEGGNTVIDASANVDGAKSVTVPAGPAGEIRGFRFSDDGAGEQYAILANGSSPTISTNDFAGFFRAVNVYTTGADATIVNNDFSGAHSSTLGSGTEIDVEFGAKATITDNAFHDPGSSPSALIVAGGGATLERNTVIDYTISIINTSLPVSLNGDLLASADDLYALVTQDTGADDPDVGDVSLTGVTFWDNGGADIGGIRVELVIDSTIVQDPINTFSAFGTTTCAITYSRGPTTTGDSCQQFQTDANPQFVDALNGDYHLSAGSPLIDAGNPATPPAGAQDLDGDPRALDGPDNGSCIGADAVRDIGADELDCRPPPDGDGDGVADADDACPAVPAPGPTGCPHVPRTLTLAYSDRAKAFKGKLSSGEPDCRSDHVVSVFRKRGGPDRKLGDDSTNARGKYKIGAPRRDGRYYATTPEVVEPAAGICQAARSPSLRLR